MVSSNWMTRLFAISCVIFTTGLTNTSCVTRGEAFSSDYHWIQKGVTTKQEVTKMLGNPYLVGYSSGRPSWTYGFYQLRLIGDSNTKELTFYWKDGGVVDDFTFRSNFPEDRNRMLKK